MVNREIENAANGDRWCVYLHADADVFGQKVPDRDVPLHSGPHHNTTKVKAERTWEINVHSGFTDWEALATSCMQHIIIVM